MSFDPDSGLSHPRPLEHTDTQNSLPLSDIPFEKLPLGRWETNLHGACPRCHHFHVGVPVTISRHPGVYNGIRCRKCGHKWFGLGGNSTHSSLVSQLTRRFSLQSSATSEPEQVSSTDERQMPSVMSLASAMHSMSAVGSPPLSVIPGPGNISPVAQRQRSISQSTAFHRPVGVPTSPIAPRRANSKLLSPIDCDPKGFRARSAPSSPVQSHPQPDAPVLPTLARSKSLRDRFTGRLNKVVSKFGYEFRKIERMDSSISFPRRPSDPDTNLERTQEPETAGKFEHAEPIPINVQPTSVLDRPDPVGRSPVIEYRRTPSGRPRHSSLELGLKRLARTAEAERKCGCSTACNCHRLGSSNASQHGSSSGSNDRPDSPEPKTPPGPPLQRFSVEFSHMQPGESSPEQFISEFMDSSDVEPEMRRRDTSGTTCSDSLSLSSGVASPNDQNLQQLAFDLTRIYPAMMEPSQSLPQAPQLRIITDVDQAGYSIQQSSGYEPDNDRTPTNRHRSG